MFATPTEKHVGLVKSAAARLASRLPASVSMQDLMDAGVEGLLDATTRYQPETNVPFPAFAIPRIQGAMLDALRQEDRLSRSARKKVRHLEGARALLEQRLGRLPREDELAVFLDVSPAQVRECELDAASAQLLSLERMQAGYSAEGDLVRGVPSSEVDMETELEHRELVGFLCQALEQLPRKDYLVLALYYYEELTQREIAAVLHLSESAVSIRHKTALDRVRKALWQRYRLDELRYGIW